MEISFTEYRWRGMVRNVTESVSIAQARVFDIITQNLLTLISKVRRLHEKTSKGVKTKTTTSKTDGTKTTTSKTQQSLNLTSTVNKGVS